jgi:squalene-associated FAD-dependent desaturase
MISDLTVEPSTSASRSAQASADCVVIGAGFAGLSAAVRLTEAGLRVVVVEEAPRLGGRASAFTDRETGERVDNGQHVLFGCYRHTYDFLRTVGAADNAPLQKQLRMTIATRDGRTSTLECPNLPAPYHLVAGLMRWRGLGMGDRLSALRLGRLLLAARRRGAATVAAGVPPGLTVTEWLARYRQSPKLCDWLWHPLAIAALNQAPDVAAAQPFVRVLAELFGPHQTDAAIGLPSVPLDELFAVPSRRAIEDGGGEVISKVTARIVLRDSGKIDGVAAGGRFIRTSAVISSAPWHAFSRQWDRGVPPALSEIAAHAAATASSPIVTVNLWFDRNVTTEKFIGLIGGPMHWVFNKSALYGDDTAHLSIVSSGAVELAEQENQAITDAAVRQLNQALPAAGARRLVRSVVVREHRATFSLAPGAPPRPATVTPIRGFFLAGDWTDTGLPGTIEGAVLSGDRAAAAVLQISKSLNL